MKNEKIVTINGQQYDAETGLPKQKKVVHQSTSDIKKIHSVAQRSQPVIKKQISKKSEINKIAAINKSGRSMDIARSKSISHFSPRTINKVVRQVAKKQQMDIGPIKHPLALKVDKSRTLQSKSEKLIAPKTLRQRKDEAIAEAMNRPAVKPKRTGFFKKHNRIINLTSISLAILLIVGYFTYVNIPSLSVRIASAQAGINASYPEYHPDGFSPSGPVKYEDGNVIINFRANTGDDRFTIKQLKSSWDSSAVKNMVNKACNGEFITTEDHGLTIYTYDGNATWVNGGILYMISSDAHLSGDQIRRIATSL